MKTGINIDCLTLGNIREQVKLLKDNGFSATFVASENERLEEVVRYTNEYEITVDTLHGPFLDNGVCRINDIWKDGEKGEKMLARMIKGLEDCSRFGIPCLITHLSSGNNAPIVNDIGFERIARLVQKADEYGVYVAFENLRKTANLACALEYNEHGKFCLDVGHQYCYTGGKQFLPMFGDRLVALHIHDNMKTIGEDMHLLPFDGAIDYSILMRQLKDCGFDGTLMIETAKAGKPQYESLSDEQFIKLAAERANKLLDLYNDIKSKPSR